MEEEEEGDRQEFHFKGVIHYHGVKAKNRGSIKMHSLFVQVLVNKNLSKVSHY